jgi:hypothetical protein
MGERWRPIVLPHPHLRGVHDWVPWHVPYEPPTGLDLYWDHSDPNDDSDIGNLHLRNDWTGLPPRDHQGFEYRWGRWPDTNGDGGPGDYFHQNAPLAPGERRRKQFVWPSDGKRKSTWGRWKDLIDSKGPDIFVTNQGHRPTRNQWRNNYQDFDHLESPWEAQRAMPWAKRHSEKPYEFRTRRYRRERPGAWSDAVWPRHEADQFDQPLSYKCRHGDWYNMKWAPFGGVPLPGYSYHRRGRDRKGLWK